MKSSKKQSNGNINSNSFIFGLFVNYLKPSAYVSSVEDISLSKLREQGIKLIICDLDNTLVPHFTKFPTKKAFNFVESAKENDFKFVLISNNTKKRVKFFSEKLMIENYIYNSKKPFTKHIKKTMKELNIKPHQTIVIGDMLITDILAANILHTESILVTPIIDYAQSSNFLARWIEKRVFMQLSRENLITKQQPLTEKEFYEDYDIL